MFNLYDFINSESENININSNQITLYHGSKSGINGLITPSSREKCDFGKGFYMGTQPEQPLTLICDFPNSKFYIMTLDLSELNVLDISPNLEWALLVAFHRGKMDKIKGTALYNKYQNISKSHDLIVGNIANDRMFYVLDNFFLGNITDTALIKSLSALQLGKQYVCITQKACDAVKIEKEISISDTDRLFLQQISAENRMHGVSLANDICRNYRREGLYFDEILENAQKEG